MDHLLHMITTIIRRYYIWSIEADRLLANKNKFILHTQYQWLEKDKLVLQI